MSIEIYHQLGYRYQWSFQSLEDDSSGQGVILSPKFMKRNFVENLGIDIKNKAIFDPQFFLPNVQRKHLETYSFFPDVAANGFVTQDYSDSFANDSAHACTKFQIENNFRYIVIPTRYYSGLPVDFIADQENLFVRPFLSAISQQTSDAKVVLQIVINNLMIGNDEYTAELLNWITGIDELTGVYIIPDVNPRAKQIKDPEFLYRLLQFIYALSSNHLDVILGYLNTEAYLLSIASPKIVTIGSYENLRMFHVRNFDEPDEKNKPRGPVPRIYTTKLLQWINHNYIGAIEGVMDPGEKIFDENKYQAEMFEETFNWHFSKPEIYKHYFLEFSGQLDGIANLDEITRFRAIRDIMRETHSLYKELENRGVYLDSDSDGAHIPAWLTAASRFAADQGWR